MPGRRLIVLAVLTTLVMLGAVAAPATQPSISSLALDPDADLLAAIAPNHREAVASATSNMPRYTIVATLMLPSEAMEAPQASAGEATSPATPVGSPQASPVAPPAASPVASSHAAPVGAGAESADGNSEQATAASGLPASREPQVIGTVDVHYVNTTGGTLDELYLRLNPNLRQYGSGSMTIANVHVGGELVEVVPPALHSVPDATPIAFADAGASDLAIVRIPLPEPLVAGDTTTLRMDFSTTVPIAPPDENGLFRYSPETGTWTLAHWFPILAGYDPQDGWDTDPPAAWSDITFANTALFDITLSAPEDLALVTTGVEVDAVEGAGIRTTRIATGPVRDVAIIADPALSATSVEVGETTIRSWYRPGEEAGAETILEWATQSFTVYSDVFGPYPYTTLDLVSVPALIGYEFPQLLMIGADFYPDPDTLGSRPGAIEFLVAHEVAHQWWYGLVGSNPHTHAFLDEGLTEYSTIVYFERQHGDEVAASHLRDGLVHRYALLLTTTGDQVVDQPTVAFPDAGAYYAAVYRKAGLGFEAIREGIGDEAFFSALRTYADQYRFGIATPEDLLAAFEKASGQELDGLWELWFERDRGRVEIVMEPLPATPALEGSPSVTPIEASPVVTPVLGASPIASPVIPTVATSPASPVDEGAGAGTPSVATPVATH